MLPFLVIFGVFACWWLLGLAALALLRADLADLRIALTAPAVGTAVALIPVFMLSYFGMSMSVGGPLVAATVVPCAGAVVWRRRPPVPGAAVLVVVIAAASAVIVGRPFFQFGFDWIANGNDDMANYVLSATLLLRHGLIHPFDVLGLATDRDFPSVMQGLHDQGSRPGADIMLGALSAVTRLPPVAMFMPLIISFAMVTVCATGALALQATRRRSAAPVAAILIGVSPLTTYGIEQQLLPQVWGLGLAAALFALLMRDELHGAPGPSIAQAAPPALLFVAFLITYIELAASLSAAYALYVAILFVRRRLRVRALVRLWGVAVLVLVVVLNLYGLSEFRYVLGQAGSGVSDVRGSLFAITLVPAALPGILGLRLRTAHYPDPYLSTAIFVSLPVLFFTGVAALILARRGAAAAVVLVSDLALGVLLGLENSAFGLFKLYMYIQPFLAALIAIVLTATPRRRALLSVASAGFVAVLVVQFAVQSDYVNQSRDPVDLHHASAPGMLPAFRRLAATSSKPILSSTENPTLAKLETAALSPQQRLFFFGPDIFTSLTDGSLRTDSQAGQRQAQTILAKYGGWKRFNWSPDHVGSGYTPRSLWFVANEHATALLARRNCVMAVPSGTIVPFNRETLPEGSPELAIRSCRAVHNLLVFTNTSISASYYQFSARSRVGIYQLERDIFFPKHTFAGVGRYLLFQVVNPSPRIRIEIDLSTTDFQTGTHKIPPVAVIGRDRVRFPVAGSGSARVISPPVTPRKIGGDYYVLLDMGVNGRIRPVRRPGIQDLFGKDIQVDPRYLTSYVRDISALPASRPVAATAPVSIQHFPSDLEQTTLSYSGIYEDGWLGRTSYAVLAGGPATNVVLRALALPVEGREHLQILVNGVPVVSRRVVPGTLELGAPIPASARPRRVTIIWGGSTTLGRNDHRRASAKLEYLGFANRLRPITHYPSDLYSTGVDYSGIYNDGWTIQTPSLLLPGGKPKVLQLQASVPAAAGQHLDVLVNGSLVSSSSVAGGALDLHIPLGPSIRSRRIELRWSKAVTLPRPDLRSVSARLVKVKLLPLRTPSSFTTASLSNPNLAYSGMYSDGWVDQDSYALLAGGGKATVTIDGSVPSIRGQHLEVLVNGRQIASVAARPGHLHLRAALPPSVSDRKIELRWRKTIRLAAPDTRVVSAQVESIRISTIR